ncbi:MAG: RluA family pseudouridine synthase [bacterium]|nr:RluA family pseudouridine synthase [bacterium]
MQTQNFPILYEDESMLVIDKPSGVTVNRSETTKDNTIQDWAEKHIGIERNGDSQRVGAYLGDTEATGEYSPRKDFFVRGGVVHRLDKETSGVLVLAKTPESFERLQREFKERVVEKTYIALAHGRVAPPIGEIRAPVGRLPWNRKQFGIVAGGRESVTKYKTISNFRPKDDQPLADKHEVYTLLELYPQTGRTHQIRVHLKHIGHPIFADFLYAGRKTARSDRHVFSRVFLHAHSLSLVHPVTEKHMTFTSPTPQDIQVFLDRLEKVE